MSLLSAYLDVLLWKNHKESQQNTRASWKAIGKTYGMP